MQSRRDSALEPAKSPQRLAPLRGDRRRHADDGFAKTRAYRIDGRPLLLVDAGRLHVDGGAFPNGLERVAVVRASRKPRVIGRVSGWARRELGPQRLGWFLIHSGRIETFRHLGSKLCIVAVNESARGATVRFAGTHNESGSTYPIAFEVVVRPEGHIVVRGSKAVQPLPRAHQSAWTPPRVPRAFRVAPEPPRLIEVASALPTAPPPTRVGAKPAAPLGLTRSWRHPHRMQEVVTVTDSAIVVHGYNELTLYRPSDGRKLRTIVSRRDKIEPFRVPPPLYSSPSVFALGDRLLLASREMVVLSETSARPMWKRTRVCGVRPSVRAAKRVGDTIYLASDPALLLAIDADTGRCRWTATSAPSTFPMALEATSTWIGVRAGSTLWVHDAATGKPRFRHRARRAFGVAASRRGVVTGVVGVGVLVLDPSTGAVVSQHRDAALAYGSFDSVAYIGAIQVIDDVAYVDAGVDFFAWPIGATAPLWRHRSLLSGPVVVLGDQLLGCDDAGNLVALEPKTGHEMWRHGGGCRLIGVVKSGDGTPLVISHAERLKAFDATRRQPMERATIRGRVTIDGKPGAGVRVHLGRTSTHRRADDAGTTVTTDAGGRFQGTVVGLGSVPVTLNYGDALRVSGQPKARGTHARVVLDGRGRYQVRVDARGAPAEY